MRRNSFGWIGIRTRWERGPRSRLSGCLFWILILVGVIIVFSLLFGGFQKGTKTGGLGGLQGLSGEITHASQW
jgi:hypothetical protein